MTIEKLSEIEFGETLPSFTPDTSLANVSQFVLAADGIVPDLLITKPQKRKDYPRTCPGHHESGVLRNDPPLGTRR